MIVVKDNNEEHEKVEKSQVDGEVIHLIALKREMELEIPKMQKKQGKQNKTKSKVDLILSYNR